jgi:Zn-finger protein
MNYPKHKHPHGIQDTMPNKYRIWVCEECHFIFSDEAARKRVERAKEGMNPCAFRIGEQCEAHLEPYIPELSDKDNK